MCVPSLPIREVSPVFRAVSKEMYLNTNDTLYIVYFEDGNEFLGKFDEKEKRDVR